MTSEPPPATARSQIARRAGIVAAGTLSSRILGAVRDAVIAAVFALKATDAFWLAFTIPNSLRVLLGEGAASGAVVPVYTQVKEQEGAERAAVYFRRLVGKMGILLLVVTLVGILAAPWIVRGYAWGYQRDPDLFETTVSLTQLLFPYIFLMGLSAIAMAGLYANKHFIAPAFAPVMLNVALIAAAFALVPVIEAAGWPVVFALGVGALIGGAMQLFVQVPSLRKRSLPMWPRFDGPDPHVRATFKLLVPLIAGLGVYQLNVLLSRLLASFLPTGSVSYLFYGQRLAEIPQGMFALAIASAALPSLSQAAARNDEVEAKRLFRFGLRLSLFVAIPSTVALMLLAKPAATIFLGRGEFNAFAVSETARSFVWQAAGIWAVASARTIVPMFHAYKDTRTPVVSGVINLIVFGAVSAALMGPMQHAGIAAATSAAALAQLVALLWFLRRKRGALGLGEVGRSVARVLICSGVMGAAVWWMSQFGQWELGGNNLRNIAVLAGTIVAGALAYLGSAAVLRAPELADVRDAITRRRRAS